MKFHKYFQYLYLFVALLFGHDAFTKYCNNETYWTSLLLGAMAVFMFFLKRRFAKTYTDNKKK
jgi:hypothetical protein